VACPFFCWVTGNLIPVQSAPVAHSDHIEFAITIDISGHIVMGFYNSSIGILDKFLLSWFSGVTEPGGA
jgi:hypothetical protein